MLGVTHILAFHEAGHLLACLELGVEVYGIEVPKIIGIISNRSDSGGVKYNTEEFTKLNLEQKGVILLAADEAVKHAGELDAYIGLYELNEIWKFEVADLDELNSILLANGIPLLEVEAKIQLLRNLAANFVSRQDIWTKIEIIALKMLQTDFLTVDEINQVLKMQ